MALLRGLLILCLISAFVGCARKVEHPSNETNFPTSKRIASTDVVKAFPEAVEIPAGGSSETVLRIAIDPGYHINANPPTYSYLKATELEIPATNGVSVGFIRYPDPIKQKFEFADDPLAVYEGEATLRIALKADKSAPKGALNLSGELRVQACDDQVCYAPGALKVSIPVTIQ